MRMNIFRLQRGISFQRIRRFRNIGLTTDIFQTQHFHFISQNGTYLLQFMGIVSSKNQFTHSRQFNTISSTNKNPGLPLPPCHAGIFFSDKAVTFT